MWPVREAWWGAQQVQRGPPPSRSILSPTVAFWLGKERLTQSSSFWKHPILYNNLVIFLSWERASQENARF